MSKKAKAPVSRAKTVALKPLEPGVGFDELVEAHNVESVAHDVIKLIIQRGTDILFSHSIQDKAEEITAVQTIENIVSTVEYQLLPHDQGELLAADEAAHHRALIPLDPDEPHADIDPEILSFSIQPAMWTAEPEPRPCDIDMWASGVVPMKEIQQVESLLALAKSVTGTSLNSTQQLDNQSDKSGRTHSVRSSHSVLSARSIRSASSQRSSRSGAASSRLTTRSGRTGRSSQAGRRSSVMHGKGGKRGTQMMRINEGPFALKVERSPHEMEMDRLRAMELQKMERKRKQLEKKQRLKFESEEELKRFEKLKAELAGKVYAFDENGEVILINLPKSVPSFGSLPKIEKTCRSRGEG